MILVGQQPQYEALSCRQFVQMTMSAAHRTAATPTPTKTPTYCVPACCVALSFFRPLASFRPPRGVPGVRTSTGHKSGCPGLRVPRSGARRWRRLDDAQGAYALPPVMAFQANTGPLTGFFFPRIRVQSTDEKKTGRWRS